MRLAKYLAHAGVASRRAAQGLIADGRARAGPGVVRAPARAVAGSIEVFVDNAPVSPPDDRLVYAVNKPAGVVSTAKDTHGRPTIVELVPSDRRLYPVGRLDAETTGLILLTDDGELANRLTHPSYEVPKVYRARVADGPVSSGALHRLRTGIRLDDGPTLPAQVTQPRPGLLEITLREGRKRQVRRMCEAVGHPVIALERVAFGTLRLTGLKRGAYRRLTPDEVAALRRR